MNHDSRLRVISEELHKLNREMQTILDLQGGTNEGREKIRVLKINHDRLLSEFNALRGLR